MSNKNDININNRIKKLVVSSPGKVIVTGEHAVVYDEDLEGNIYKGITASIGKRSTVTFKSLRGDYEYSQGRTMIHSPELNTVRIFYHDELERIYNSFERIFNSIEATQVYINPYVNFHRALKGTEALALLRERSEVYLLDAFLFTVGHYINKYNNYIPASITIETDLIKGLGRSGSIAAAMAGASHVFYSDKKGDPIKKITDTQRNSFIEIALKTDNICHGGLSSGIDPSTSVYGGLNVYSSREGLETMKNNLKECFMLIVDSGEESRTAQATEYVASEVARDVKCTGARRTLTEINKTSYETIKHFEKGDIVGIGANMTELHYLLRKLGVSTPRLDKIVEGLISNDNIYGAKLTGAGMGGSVIAISDQEEELAKILESCEGKGLKAYVTTIATIGTKLDDIEYMKTPSSYEEVIKNDM